MEKKRPPEAGSPQKAPTKCSYSVGENIGVSKNERQVFQKRRQEDRFIPKTMDRNETGRKIEKGRKKKFHQKKKRHEKGRATPVGPKTRSMMYLRIKRESELECQERKRSRGKSWTTVGKGGEGQKSNSSCKKCRLF